MLTPVEDDGESSCSEMLDTEVPFETEEEKSAERFVFHDHQLLSNMRMKLMAFSTAFLLF